jgi:hypothetical protein
MSTFAGFEKFLENINAFSAEKVVEQQLVLDKAEIVIMVKLQLESGIDGNDDPVYLYRRGARRKDYARYTIQQKDMFGVGIASITDHITNYMSGEFYNSIYVDVYSNGNFEVKSRSSLYELIKFRSGADIINLSPSSEQWLFEQYIAPDIQAEINSLFYA